MWGGSGVSIQLLVTLITSDKHGLTFQLRARIVTGAHIVLYVVGAALYAAARLSLAATPSHLHLARVQLCRTDGACVFLSGTRSISNTKGSELPELGFTSGLITRRNRVPKGGGLFPLVFHIVSFFFFFKCPFSRR